LNKINITFLCNFKPNWTFKKKFKKKIFCKNFIVFLLFLNFFQQTNASVFIKPLKKKTLSILKAPHRFKLFRHLVFFSRYEVVFSLKYKKQCFEGSTLGQFICFIAGIRSLFRKIDSSICYQKVIKPTFTVSSKIFLK